MTPSHVLKTGRHVLYDGIIVNYGDEDRKKATELKAYIWGFLDVALPDSLQCKAPFKLIAVPYPFRGLLGAHFLSPTMLSATMQLVSIHDMLLGISYIILPGLVDLFPTFSCSRPMS